MKGLNKYLLKLLVKWDLFEFELNWSSKTWFCIDDKTCHAIKMKDLLKEGSSDAMISQKRWAANLYLIYKCELLWIWKCIGISKLKHIFLIDFRFHFMLTYVFGNFVLLGNWNKLSTMYLLVCFSLTLLSKVPLCNSGNNDIRKQVSMAFEHGLFNK